MCDFFSTYDAKDTMRNHMRGGSYSFMMDPQSLVYGRLTTHIASMCGMLIHIIGKSLLRRLKYNSSYVVP